VVIPKGFPRSVGWVKAGFLAFHTLSLPWPDFEMHFTNHREGPFWELEPLVRDADYTARWAATQPTKCAELHSWTLPRLSGPIPIIVK